IATPAEKKTTGADACTTFSSTTVTGTKISSQFIGLRKNLLTGVGIGIESSWLVCFPFNPTAVMLDPKLLSDQQNETVHGSTPPTHLSAAAHPEACTQFPVFPI